MKTVIKLVTVFFIAIVAIVGGYLGATVIGAYFPRSPEHPTALIPTKDKREVYLLSSLLHADFVLPDDPYVFEKLGFLSEAGINFEHPGFRHLAIGWGSRAFYPLAAELNKVSVAATAKAVIGDRSVIHAVAFGEIAEPDGLLRITLSEKQFQSLIDFIAATFRKDDLEQAIWLEGVTHGYGDAFYEANGHFNIFNPCNIWIADALHHSGVNIGRWTPTTFSLHLSLGYFRS